MTSESSLCIFLSVSFSYTHMHTLAPMRTQTRRDTMGWLRLVRSLKLWVSLTEYSLFYRALLQKRHDKEPTNRSHPILKTALYDIRKLSLYFSVCLSLLHTHAHTRSRVVSEWRRVIGCLILGSFSAKEP